MKKIFKITFFVALALSLLVATLLTVSAVSALSDSSVSIIGGADGPTAVFITSTLLLDSPAGWVLCLALITLIASAIGWVVNKKK